MTFLGTISVNQFPGIGTKPDRLAAWYRYYEPLKARLGVDCLVSSTDSNKVNLDIGIPVRVSKSEDLTAIKLADDRLNLLTFNTELARKANDWTYPAYWRSLAYLVMLAARFQCPKLLVIETDCWVLSGRMAECMKGFNSGMAMCWCELHQFPECQAMVICQDRYGPLLNGILAKSWAVWSEAHTREDCCEKWIARVGAPTVLRYLVGDRYSEYPNWENPRGRKEFPVSADADFVAQGENYVPTFRP